MEKKQIIKLAGFVNMFVEKFIMTVCKLLGIFWIHYHSISSLETKIYWNLDSLSEETFK